MSDYEVKMVILSTDDLDESIRFYTETLDRSSSASRPRTPTAPRKRSMPAAAAS